MYDVPCIISNNMKLQLMNMIDYYLVDFWIGLGQSITVILMCVCFFAYMLLDHHRKPVLILTVVFTILNFVIMVFSAAWPYIL